MSDNPLDTSNHIGYNQGNDDYAHVVKMDEQSPLNDPNCEHFLLEDPTDTLGEHIAWVCNKCGLGTFCPPGFDPNDTYKKLT